MAEPGTGAIVDALLDRHGRTYAEELGVDVARGTPSVLFRLLVASILFSARINASQGVKAARALFGAGWTTAEKLAATTWRERATMLNRHGYARYDERTASILGDACALLLDRYRGDLRRLRAEAGRDPARERRLLKEVKGVGDVGADIFFREAQVAWEELFPYLDRRAAAAAAKLGLPADVRALARGRDPHTFARIVAALVRTELAGDHGGVLEAARAGERVGAGRRTAER